MTSIAGIVVLVGTSHTYQYSGNKGETVFRNMIERICYQHSIRAIAEELSEEALAENNVATSICRQIAGALSIPHRCIDPSTDQRRAMGIYQENEIRAQAHFSEKTEEAILDEILASKSARESFWLDQLLKLNLSPTLFICGANHVESFSGILKAKHFTSTIAHRDWSIEGDSQ